MPTGKRRLEIVGIPEKTELLSSFLQEDSPSPFSLFGREIYWFFPRAFAIIF
jgi:hypothetical protein